MTAPTPLADVLRAQGHRVTRPRQVVWSVLHDADRHLTVEQVAARAQAREPGVNLASVYRTLALFEQLDLARQSRLADASAGRWELAHPDEHFHLVCETCGEVDHHAGTLVAEIRRHLADGHGFEAAGVELVVTGRCRGCAGADGDA